MWEGRIGRMMQIEVVEIRIREQRVELDSPVEEKLLSVAASDTHDSMWKLEIDDPKQVHIDQASSSFDLPSLRVLPVLVGIRVEGSSYCAGSTSSSVPADAFPIRVSHRLDSLPE